MKVDLEKFSSLVTALSACEKLRHAASVVRMSAPMFTRSPADGYGALFVAEKVVSHEVMTRISGALRETAAGPEFGLLKWSSPSWPADGLGRMIGDEVLETLSLKATYRVFCALESELSCLSAVEQVGNSLVVETDPETAISANSLAIIVGLMFGKKVDCSSSYITWVYKAQLTVGNVDVPIGVTRALLRRASSAARIRYYGPETVVGAATKYHLSPIKRFHYELKRRFDYRRETSDYEKDSLSVIEAISMALCSEHDEQTHLVEPLLAVLYTRRGDCAMLGGASKAVKRSIPCVLCLYGSELPGRVQSPMIYSNTLLECGEGIEDDLKTIDEEIQKPDYCDRWAHKLLSMLFSGNWNAMELAVYSDKQPVIAGDTLRCMIGEMMKGNTSSAIREGLTPWVVFEVCTAYGLDCSRFIQSMYDQSVELVLAEGSNRDVVDRVERVLAGTAAIYDYRKLKDPKNITVGSVSRGITGCLYLYNSLEDRTFTDRYIFHRWLMEKAYSMMRNERDDLKAIRLWCDLFDIKVSLEGSSLKFKRGPWCLEGVLERVHKGMYHYAKGNGEKAASVPSTERVQLICGPGTLRATLAKTEGCDSHGCRNSKGSE